jgi:hypothetical protein
MSDPNEFTIDAILCDSAVTADGRLFMQGGGWNLLNAPSLPFTQNRIAVGMTMGVPYTATNQKHKLMIELAHQDGESIRVANPTSPEESVAVRAGAEFNLGRPPILEPGERQTVPFAVNFDGLVFPTQGVYSFSFKIDDKEINRLEFRVVHVNQLTISR